MNRLFISQVVPREFIAKFDVSQAANNFCFNLIESECFDFTISMIPINVTTKIFPMQNKRVKYIQSRKFRQQYIGRYLNALVESFKTLKIAYKFDNIWFYNITIFNLFVYFCLKYILFKKVYVIMADYTPSNKFFSVKRLIKYLIEHCYGIISLSDRSEFNHRNMLVIPGIVPLNKIKKINNILNQPGNRTFLFSGVLGPVTGLQMALDVFKELPDIDLYISGRGDESYFQEYTKKYPNIHYLGFLSYTEYLDLLTDVDVCLSFRNPGLPENNNNFPSKILEYFSYNKAIISTINYPELLDFKYFKCSYNKDALKQIILKIQNMTQIEFLSYCDHSTLLRNKFSEKAWEVAFDQVECNVG